MLMSIGRGLSSAISQPYNTNYKKFLLTSSLPNEVTFERASPATVTNASGKIIEVPANTPRFDHDEYGNKLGILIEPEITNKCSNSNVNPIDTSGITTSGDINGVLSIINDASALATADLDQICTNGNVFKADNTAGTFNFTIYINGTVGNLNPHTLSIYTRSPNSSGRVCRLYVGADTLNINANNTWNRNVLENQTPNSTGRKMTIIVDPGKEVYFILNQMEEYPIATSIITTSGAATTRKADRPYIANINQYNWFDSAQGYLTCRYSLKELLNVDSYVGVIHDGSSANTIGLRMDASTNVLRGYMRSNSTSQFTLANSDVHIANICHTSGTMWNNTNTSILSGGSKATGTITALPTNLNRLEIGARNGGSSAIHGHIQEIEIGKTDLSINTLGQKLQKPSDIIIAGGGQSLIRGHFSSNETGNENGKQEHRLTIGNRLRENCVVMVDGSSGGSAASKTSNTTNYWWDLSTNSRGPAFDTFIQNMNNSCIKPTYILWGQGEEDSHNIGTNTTTLEYRQALDAIFSDIRTVYGDIPFFIQRIGRRSAFANSGGVQAVREIQNDIINTNSWCYDAGEIYDQTLFDQVHLNDIGYINVARRNSSSILEYTGAITNGSTGPIITNASLVGTTVTVSLSHDKGSDFTPTSAIDGFVFFDGSNKININSAVRASSSTITLTLASTPTQNTQTLYYGYDDMAGINVNNVIHDNSVDQMPLRTAKITVN